RMHRWIGMELFGAEIEPDATMWDGEYLYEPLAKMRERLRAGLEYVYDYSGPDWGWKTKVPEFKIPLRPSSDEIHCAQRYGLANKPRFHYRYLAAQMAREAAHMLPDDSNEAAMMLAESGLWLPTNEKGTDPFF